MICTKYKLRQSEMMKKRLMIEEAIIDSKKQEALDCIYWKFNHSGKSSTHRRFRKFKHNE